MPPYKNQRQSYVITSRINSSTVGPMVKAASLCAEEVAAQRDLPSHGASYTRLTKGQNQIMTIVSPSPVLGWRQEPHMHASELYPSTAAVLHASSCTSLKCWHP